MSDTPKTAEQALAALRERAAEHQAGSHEADREYGAGIIDAITALEPFLNLGQPGAVVAGQARPKVTKLQQEVLDLLKAGWELGVTSRLVERRVWMQKDGLGKGGETRKIRMSVFEALLAGNYLVRSDSSDTTTLVYVLAPGVNP